MRTSSLRAAFLVAMVPACVVGEDAPPGLPSGSPAGGGEALAKPALAPGEVKVWTFDGPEASGIDPRFEKIKVKNAKAISFKQGPTQQITMTGTNEPEAGQPGQANIALAIADLPVGGGGDHYYKGWLGGNVLDSNNSSIGFCGGGGFAKSEFRAQLQLAFMAGNRNLGLCYCNVCPAKDGRGTWCATDQWQVGDDDGPRVSHAGACKAPAGTDHVLVTIEAVAKGDPAVQRRGTAVFQHVTVGRCLNDGSCPDSMTPNAYGN